MLLKQFIYESIVSCINNLIFCCKTRITTFVQSGNFLPYFLKFLYHRMISINSKVTVSDKFPQKYYIGIIHNKLSNKSVHCSNKPNILPLLFSKAICQNLLVNYCIWKYCSICEGIKYRAEEENSHYPKFQIFQFNYSMKFTGSFPLSLM